MAIELKTPPDQIKERFLSLKTSKDLAALIDVDLSKFMFIIYGLSHNIQYASFRILKKSGGSREIRAPISALKTYQRRLNYVLHFVYNKKPSAHGFLLDRSILSNAQRHVGRRYVFNIDLLNFFPSIHFGRVRGLFMGKPYFLPIEVATTIAHMCCHEKVLPQGAPTSPIISNMICGQLDSNLQALAKDNRCTYTRYADDITFSTNQKNFPRDLAKIKENESLGIFEVGVGDRLRAIIEQNDFKINQDKVRLQHSTQRQEVTGLIVNEFPNVNRRFVRNIRAIFHDIKVNGFESAEAKFNKKRS